MKITLNHNEIELTSNVSLDYLRKQSSNSTWWNEIISFLEQWANSSPTINIQTSGSTGEPKQYKIEKAKMWVSASKTCDFFKLNSNSTALLCLSANYIAGKMMLVRAMVSGMNLLCIEPCNNPVIELKEDINFAAMVPLQVQQAATTNEKLNNIKNLIIGGGQVSAALVEQLANYNGSAYETFGMTETLSHIALKQLTPINQNYFTPLHGISILQGFDHCLIIDYPELGIYKLKTNDIIELTDSSGKFIWKGRSDFVINSGGVKISPEQVEQQINNFIEPRFCIIGLPDDKLGEKLVLVIEAEAYDTKNLQMNLEETLSSYFLPKEIIFLNEFPTTQSGKIKRKELVKLI